MKNQAWAHISTEQLLILTNNNMWYQHLRVCQQYGTLFFGKHGQIMNNTIKWDQYVPVGIEKIKNQYVTKTQIACQPLVQAVQISKENYMVNDNSQQFINSISIEAIFPVREMPIKNESIIRQNNPSEMLICSEGGGEEVRDKIAGYGVVATNNNVLVIQTQHKLHNIYNK
jgi:hypothetical protein